MKIPDSLETDCACVFKFNCSNLPTAMLSVDVTENSLTTMSTQLQPECIRDDDDTIARVNTNTHTQTDGVCVFMVNCSNLPAAAGNTG